MIERQQREEGGKMTGRHNTKERGRGREREREGEREER